MKKKLLLIAIIFSISLHLLIIFFIRETSRAETSSDSKIDGVSINLRLNEADIAKKKNLIQSDEFHSNPSDNNGQRDSHLSLPDVIEFEEPLQKSPRYEIGMWGRRIYTEPINQLVKRNAIDVYQILHEINFNYRQQSQCVLKLSNDAYTASINCVESADLVHFSERLIKKFTLVDLLSEPYACVELTPKNIVLTKCAP